MLAPLMLCITPVIINVDERADSNLTCGKHNITHTAEKRGGENNYVWCISTGFCALEKCNLTRDLDVFT